MAPSPQSDDRRHSCEMCGRAAAFLHFEPAPVPIPGRPATRIVLKCLDCPGGFYWFTIERVLRDPASLLAHLSRKNGRPDRLLRRWLDGIGAEAA